MAGNIMEFIILLLAHSVAGLYSSTLKYDKRITYLIWGAWIALQSSLLFYTEFVLTDWMLKFLVGFILSIIGQYTIFFLTTKGKVADRIFIISTYSILFCIAMTFMMMVNGSLPNIHWGLRVLIQALILSAVVAYFIGYVCPLCRRASKNTATDWAPMIFVNLVFLITIIFSAVFPARLLSFSDPAFITFVFLSISIMAVYPVIFSNINNMSEASMKRTAETQNKLLLAQIETKTVQLEADSQARHDRRHHNLVMLEFANNNDIESIRKYLGNLVEADSAMRSEVRYCDNLTVNTILTVYERRAREEGIAVNIRATVSRELSVLAQDLVIVIANVFENAVNAVSKLEDRDKYVNITIKDDVQRLVVIASNPCSEEMTFDEGCYGIGIRSVISTVGKYDGMYDFSAEEGLFSAKISLNL